MLYIKSSTNNSVTSVTSKVVNIFAGDSFTDIYSGDRFYPLCITTELGTSKIVAYHEKIIEQAVNTLFEFILNFDFDNKNDTIIDITSIVENINEQSTSHR